MTRRLAAGDRVSEYLLLEKVGEGGFGEVWKARHHVFELDLVAVKVPTDPAFAAQLRLEGKLQHDLAHPHIVRTLGLDAAADPPYFVMDWVEGPSLRDALRERGRLGFAQALEVAAQVLEALAHAHARGVVHRDVKPENVLVSWKDPLPPCSEAEAAPPWKALTHRTLHARLADFGLGRVTQAAARSLLLSGTAATAPGAIGGTLAYMAPEQKRGVDSGPRADVFAFGMLFYEAIVGVPPEGAFRDASQVDPLAPPGFDAFLRRCLAQLPEDRFADAREVLLSLRSLLGVPPPVQMAPAPRPQPDVAARPLPRPACLCVRERRYVVVARGEPLVVPIAVENLGEMLLSVSIVSQVPWASSPSGDVTVKGMREIEVQVDARAAGASEDAPAEGGLLVRSNGGEASVRLRVVAVPRVDPLGFLIGAILAYLCWLPGWWAAFAWLGLCAGARIWCGASSAREWGLTEAILDAWTRRRRASWVFAGSIATVLVLAICTLR